MYGNTAPFVLTFTSLVSSLMVTDHTVTWLAPVADIQPVIAPSTIRYCARCKTHETRTLHIFESDSSGPNQNEPLSKIQKNVRAYRYGPEQPTGKIWKKSVQQVQI